MIRVVAGIASLRWVGQEAIVDAFARECRRVACLARQLELADMFGVIELERDGLRGKDLFARDQCGARSWRHPRAALYRRLSIRPSA